MENQNLAQRVKELRKRKVLSQDELAKNSGLSLRTVQRVENGETIPTAETLKRLASVLDVAPNELMDADTSKELLKKTIKTKYEYVHIFDNKLVFSKTPEINLVEDYGKSVGYAFKTLMVFFVFIPVFTTMTIIFYNMQKMDLAFYSGASCFFFLIMAFYTMLFTSGTPVVNIDTITGMKIKNKLSQNIVEISFVESGRIKGRGLILEKDQVDIVINSLLSEQLIEQKDIKINKNGAQIRSVLFISLPMFVSFFYSIYNHNPKVQMYFYGTFIMIVSLYIIVKMIRKTINPMNRTIRKTDSGLPPVSTKQIKK